METNGELRQKNSVSEMIQENQDRNNVPTNGVENDPTINEIKRTANRGFAAMDPEKQKQIAQQGGRAAHKQGVAHRWTSEEARLAGRKGGQNGGKRTGPTDER